MPLLLTLDASVFVAACHPPKHGHGAGQNLLDQLSSTSLPLIELSIFPVGVAAALRRAWTTLARKFVESILALSHLIFVDWQDWFAHPAGVVATQHQLRGVDALYVQAVLRHGTPLVTWEREQLQCDPRALHACDPDDALALLTP